MMRSCSSGKGLEALNEGLRGSMGRAVNLEIDREG